MDRVQFKIILIKLLLLIVKFRSIWEHRQFTTWIQSITLVFRDTSYIKVLSKLILNRYKTQNTKANCQQDQSLYLKRTMALYLNLCNKISNNGTKLKRQFNNNWQVLKINSLKLSHSRMNKYKKRKALQISRSNLSSICLKILHKSE